MNRGRAAISNFVTIEKTDGVGRLRLTRSDKRNAINEEMAVDIIEAMSNLDEDSDIIAIVIEGSEGSFCAGADMAEANAAYERGERRFNPAQEAANRVAASEKPTIASVDGPAYGAGAALACACDIRICSDRTRFRFPGADYGLVVGAAALPSIVGGPIAKELIFTSRVVDAEEALDIGLVNKCVSQAEFSAAVDLIANQVAAASPLALRWSKSTINASINGGDAVGLEGQADLLLRGGPDHQKRFSQATQKITGNKR